MWYPSVPPPNYLSSSSFSLIPDGFYLAYGAFKEVSPLCSQQVAQSLLQNFLALFLHIYLSLFLSCCSKTLCIITVISYFYGVSAWRCADSVTSGHKC